MTCAISEQSLTDPQRRCLELEKERLQFIDELRELLDGRGADTLKLIEERLRREEERVGRNPEMPLELLPGPPPPLELLPGTPPPPPATWFHLLRCIESPTSVV
ncbi:MAG: hypothetical protein GY820_26770 [Gammaproteobacteria bacterium]|nr:hypothetical protein [Gammaproteobacteria bacterium]